MANAENVVVLNTGSNPVPVSINVSEQVNAQTGTSYTVLSSDWGKLITFSNGSAIAVTLPQANSTTFPNGWYIDVVNLGAGTVTITPTTSTIQGASDLALVTGDGTRIVSDGTDYFIQPGLAGTVDLGVVPGTVTASKAVVVDSNKDITTFRNLTATNLKAGASGTAGTVDVFPSTGSKGRTEFTATDNSGNTTTTITTAAQAGARTYTIPDAGGSTSFVMGAGTQTVAGAKTFSSAIVTGANNGTANTGTTAVEYGDGRLHQTVLTVNTTLPAIAGGAALGLGKLLYTFPAGSVIIESSYMSMAITQTQGHINADTPDVGLGTVIASGAVSVLDGTATFENIITGQTAADCNGTATVVTLIPTANVPFIIAAGDDHTLYFNAAATWSASGDAAALLTGTVVVNWRFMA